MRKPGRLGCSGLSSARGASTARTTRWSGATATTERGHLGPAQRDLRRAGLRHAVGYLPRLRDLDESRLVLLSSGRWDGDLGVGSVSNPGEATGATSGARNRPTLPR